MNSNFKKSKSAKLIAGFVSLTTGVLMLGGAAFTASAQTSTEDLTKQINDMVALIATLQAQLSGLSGVSSAPVATGTGYTFTSNLSKGDKGEDVKQLQMALNADGTQVASTGVGSTGNETTFFGSLTKSAVIRFQNKYSSEILAPVGLSAGTGFVGPSTRAKLNSMNVAVVVVPVVVNSIVKIQEENNLEPQNTAIILNGREVTEEENFMANSIPITEELLVMFPSQYSGPIGTNIILYGAGFAKDDNTVYFGDEYIIKNISTRSTGALAFDIPSSFEPGNYKIKVSNKKGMSKSETFFVVIDAKVPEPAIESIFPKEVKYGDTVTIKGFGFTKNNNTIRASYDIIEEVESLDGETITIKVKPPFLDGVLDQMLGSGTKYEFWVYVINKHGVSEEGIFFLKL